MMLAKQLMLTWLLLDILLLIGFCAYVIGRRTDED